MPSVQYGTGSYDRADGNFPELVLINMHLEAAKTSEQGVALLSRPGLAVNSTVGGGPINGMFSKAGTFSGDIFALSGSTLYRGSTSLGSVTGSGAFRPAGGYNEVLVTRGGTLYSYNGTNLASAGFTGDSSNNVASCCFINSLFVAIEAGSARFYWSAALNGRSWDVLNFATAEREPDSLLDCARLGNNLWLFGQNTVEAWAHTGEATPFTSIPSVLFDKGLHSTGCVIPADNSLFFISEDNMPYRIGEVPEPIGHNGIVERIGDSTTARMFTFWHNGHEFVAIRLDTLTLLYDCSTQEWCEFQTSGANWIAAHAAMVGDTAYFGHSSTGQIMTFSGWQDISAALERRFTFAQELVDPTSIFSVKLWCNGGQSGDLALDPVIELRLSDDAGQTWGEWGQDSLGATGNYRTCPEWRALGMFEFPGVMGEVRVTDAVPFRLSAVKINDPKGGRSR
jgi:hypothetical protein